MIQTINCFKYRFLKSLRRSFIGLAIALSSVVVLSGCATVAIATVAITSVDIIHDRRTVGEYIDDSAIEITFKKYALRNKQSRYEAHINGTSWNGILLLTGEVRSEKIKQDYVTYANAIQGVRQVVDETIIAGKTGFFSRRHDTWITTKVKTSLITRLGLRANRIKVVTEADHVYLMGIVTEDEANSATSIARSIRGVARVVKVFELMTSAETSNI